MKPICYGSILSLLTLFSFLFQIFNILKQNEIIQIYLNNFKLILLTLFIILFILTILSGSSAQNMSKDFPLQFKLAAQFRTTVLMFIVIPLSYLRWLHTTISDYYRYNYSSGPKDSHIDRVNRIIKQIKEWNYNGRKNIMRTARPNWASMSTKLSSNKGDSNKISTHELTHILNIDEKNMTICCEPSVTMGQITHHLLPKGYALLIQVEMESITIGGVSMGFGMETNSHLIGFFQESVVEYEIIDPQGEVIKVNKDSDPELFYALPWSCGTLGFLVSVTVKISKVKKYVHVKYLPTYSSEELGRKMKELAESDNPPYFLEATIYSHEQAVIQMGNYCDGPSDPSIKSKEPSKLKINGINWWWKPFYYKWVETFLKKGEGEEIIPLQHYYHRFTRSIFWELEDMIPFSNHPLYRIFWGWMGAPEVSLLKLFQGPVIRKASVYAHVVQESIMPIRYLQEGIKRFDSWYGVYPLLVFPLRVYDRKEHSGFLTPRKENLIPGKNYGIWVDLGAYGAPRDVKAGKTWDAKKSIREMEHWTRDIGGWQAYYTDIMCTKKEFRSMYNHYLVDKCRKRLKAEDAFPEIYDKVKPESGIVDLTEEYQLEKEQEEQEEKSKIQTKKSTTTTTTNNKQ